MSTCDKDGVPLVRFTQEDMDAAAQASAAYILHLETSLKRELEMGLEVADTLKFIGDQAFKYKALYETLLRDEGRST